MEILINILDGAYEAIKQAALTARDRNYGYLAIANGKVLPKGHGRIIAEPTEGDIAKTIGGQNDFAECIREAVKAVFDNAPTIIEADKEKSEE